MPLISKSPEEKVRPILSPKRAEFNLKEELQKGSEKLRQEASQNLQQFGGTFMPDFYGGKARLEFLSNNNFEENVSGQFLLFVSDFELFSKDTMIFLSFMKLEEILIKVNGMYS